MLYSMQKLFFWESMALVPKKKTVVLNLPENNIFYI